MPCLNINYEYCNVAMTSKYYLYNSFRKQRMSLSTLNKLLSESSKTRRRRAYQVNIRVTIIVWLVEFLGSFAGVFIPSLFGHGQLAMAIDQVFIVLLYFILQPFSYMINSHDTKAAIVDGNWCTGIKGIVKRNNQILPS